MHAKSFAAVMTLLALAVPAHAAESVAIPMHLISADGVGQPVGTVTAAAGQGGLVLTPSLTGLPPGPHGFHVHQNPSCGPGQQDGKAVAGLAAGGHYDPQNTGTHRGPHGDGHKGDLPALEVAADGTASKPVTSSRLTLDDLKGRSLVIHAGGDNYSDQPAPLGGGGARIACGVVP